MVQDLSYNLCESLVKNIDGVAGIGKHTPPTPITYLTQWKIVGNSEVHTLPYPDGVVLPTGYKRCKYLTFDGNSYINTGIKTANDIGFSLDLSTTSTSKTIIGARASDNKGVVFGYNYVAGGVTNKIYFAYGGFTVEYTVQTNIGDGLLHHIVLDSQQSKIDNESVEITRGDTFPQHPIYIGTWRTGGYADSRIFIGNIYDTIIYNTQGELWHGIPCLDANDVPCFYDTISQTAFYNQGSGSFTYKLYPQPTEILSCGDYSAVDSKYHVKISNGVDVFDIALTAPLRKVNSVADTIEFPSSTEGKALITRLIGATTVKELKSLQRWNHYIYTEQYVFYNYGIPGMKYASSVYALIPGYTQYSDTFSSADDAILDMPDKYYSFGYRDNQAYTRFYIKDYDYSDVESFIEAKGNIEIIYELATPTTELIDAPQIEEADSYTCVINQGTKAVSWSSFSTD